jgi:hypothetical protein
MSVVDMAMKGSKTSYILTHIAINCWLENFLWAAQTILKAVKNIYLEHTLG